MAASAHSQSPAAAAKHNQSDARRKVASTTDPLPFDLLAQARSVRRGGFSLMPLRSDAYTSANNLNMTAAAAGSAPAVLGSGTVGKISLWIDTLPSGNTTLGDSIITQSGGNIGIGLITPASKLTVQGMIETTLGGYKFPDGTIQTTAAVSGLQSVFHDATLQGNGTSGSPLGVAVPLNLTGSGSSSVLNVSHTDGGIGVAVEGSVHVRAADNSLAGFASLGVQAIGGSASVGGGGEGVNAIGGDGILGGNGVNAIGCNSSGGRPE
jgi:hypothetical protein